MVEDEVAAVPVAALALEEDSFLDGSGVGVLEVLLVVPLGAMNKCGAEITRIFFKKEGIKNRGMTILCCCREN